MAKKIKIPFEKLASGDNIAEQLNKDQLSSIGLTVKQWFDVDKASRAGWEEKQKTAYKLALQVMEKKHYPWPNAANVKFPLLTIGSMQFSSRVYPALIKAPNLAHYRAVGKDPNGQKAARASRVGKFISWQLLEQDEDWEENQDKLFMVLPILGCAFKKTYYDPLLERVSSTLILPQDLVINYYAKSIENCGRKTEIIQLWPHEVRERQLRGIFLETTFATPSNNPKDTDERQGITPPSPRSETDPYTFLECHCLWDFDGDGYEEPYIVTIEKESCKVVRIVSRFDIITTKQSLEAEDIRKRIAMLQKTVPAPEQGSKIPPERLAAIRKVERQIVALAKRLTELADEKLDIVKIDPNEYYTKYSFIPSPDGGFYDLGFGALLGPINESINTILNQLLDSGSLSIGNQGFIGRGAKIQGGRIKFQPNEYVRVNVAGSTLRDSIVPLPTKEPSGVLFQLLGLLITYSERIGSVTEAVSGENPGQNTPAYNMKAMLEQGLQVFNGIFKRVYRSFRAELRKIYKIDAKFLEPEFYVSTLDGDISVLEGDFGGDPKDLLPAANPNAFSNMEALMKAQFLAERAVTTPGYNPIAVERRLLEGMDIPDVQEIYPVDEKGNLQIPPQPNPELEIKKAEEQRRTLESRARMVVDSNKAEGQMALWEAQAIKALAEADAIDEKTKLAKAELILKTFEANRDADDKDRELEIRNKEAEAKRIAASKSNNASDSSNSD